MATASFLVGDDEKKKKNEGLLNTMDGQRLFFSGGNVRKEGDALGGCGRA